MSDLIEKLSNLRSQFNCFDENERDAYHTLSEAIKVLSERPEPCEDAVSRKDAIIQLSHNKNGDPDCDVIIQHDIETLKRMPPVTPKRKTGRWLDNYQYGYKCSECGAYLEIDCGDVEMNFCPNCNADMRGKQDE